MDEIDETVGTAFVLPGDAGDDLLVVGGGARFVGGATAAAEAESPTTTEF